MVLAVGFTECRSQDLLCGVSPLVNFRVVPSQANDGVELLQLAFYQLDCPLHGECGRYMLFVGNRFSGHDCAPILPAGEFSFYPRTPKEPEVAMWEAARNC